MNAAFRLELRRDRMLLFWLGLISAVYAGFMTLFFPTILENSAQFEKLLEAYPKELMAAFGLQGGLLSDPGTFLNMYIFQFLWPLLAAIGAIFLGTRVAADADRGFLDLPLSTRLPRVRYLGATIVAQLVGLTLVSAAMVVAVFVGDLLIEPDFDWVRVGLTGVHALVFAAAITGVTTALAVVLLDRGRAAGLAAGILILMWLLNVIAQLSPDLKDLATLSAFHYFDVTALIDSGTYPIGASLLYLAFAIGGWGLALPLFRRRDLSV